MKRALALLEQTKHTMPHLPRPPTTGEEQDTPAASNNLHLQYSKGGKRTPSASIRDRLDVENRSSHNKIVIGNGTEMSSRKSTAVSSTTRIANNTKPTANPLKKRDSFLGQSATHQAIDIMASNKAPCELSLKGPGAGKKPPQRLKPLSQNQQMLSKTMNGGGSGANHAQAVLNIENAYQKEMMREIDDDLEMYLDAGSIMSQMHSAFGGTNTSDIIALTESKSKKKESKKQIKSLDPILEETNNTTALVAYQPNLALHEQRSKKNELLKQKVKKLTGGGTTEPMKALNSSENGYKGDGAEADTFITGTKIAQEDEHILAEYDTFKKQRAKKHYKYEEDELLDDLEEHERDMNEMLKYLSEVEDLIKGQDLKSIQQMMDVTKETMTQHFQAYDKFKGQIEEIDSQADAAIKILSLYGGADEDSTSVSTNKSRQKPQMQLERVVEEQNEDKTGKVSQEKQKTGIVDQLVGMTSSMKDFSSDLESRLDRVYKQGATKKFGYEGITNTAKEDVTIDGVKGKEDRKLAKIQSQASKYIKQNSASSVLNQHHM